MVSTSPPANVTVGTPFGFTLAAEDVYGNLATAFSGNVSVALIDQIQGAAPFRRRDRSAANGLAVFSGLALNNTGGGYQLAASDSGLSSAAVRPST